MSAASMRRIAVAGILGILALHLAYTLAICKYSIAGALIAAPIIVLPSTLWLISTRYSVSAMTSFSFIAAEIWVHHMQCVSASGPFVGGLVLVYLTLGLFVSVFLGLTLDLGERIVRRITKAK